VDVGTTASNYKAYLYLEAWRERVEKFAADNYPPKVRQKSLYGTVVLTVSIRADGTLEQISAKKSSGSGELDDIAVRLVKEAAPFPPFSEDLGRDTDIITITRPMSFVKG
jgi:protein TonB